MTEPLFAGLVGQGQATGLLLAALEQQRLAPAYLFCGARRGGPIDRGAPFP
ncbi:MAG: hypothetical protein RLZZ186_1318 [Cyanobacteriota bacterium]|jgi:DNA polymerase-3 subunit delta'